MLVRERLRHKSMLMSKPVRWTLAIVFGLLLILTAPMALFMASNFGSAALSLILDREPERGELLGRYSYTASGGNSSLELRSDGSFHQEIVEVGHPARTIKGRWSSQPSMNFAEVDLTPFGMVWDEDHTTTTGSYRMDFYKPRLGRTYAVINDDLGEQFKREQ